eukprot:augustus_masked-scaffold_29-processed-gene-2.21-mRNA-1 protein AED:0.35 eAED:0.35 QI:0/0/0/0.5/1/1/2/0/445
MRLSWAVGQAGWVKVMLMFLIGETAALLTVLSMSALISTGKIKGGGSYYLLSRSLGAEIGGAIGIVFYLAYAIATSFNVVGFATEVVDTIFPELSEVHSNGKNLVLSIYPFESFGLRDSSVKWDFNKRKVFITVCASVALWCVTIVSYIGAGFFAKINSFVFALQASAVVLGIFSIYYLSDSNNAQILPSGSTNATIVQELGFFDLLQENMWESYGQDPKCSGSSSLFASLCDFRLVFGILFNAVTGIMEGANLSGDLADPKRAIPLGTIYAVFTAWSLYTKVHFVDVLVLGEHFELEGELSLQIQLAHILTQKEKTLRLRLLNVIPVGNDQGAEELQKARLRGLLEMARLKTKHIQFHVLKMDNLPLFDRSVNSVAVDKLNTLLTNFYFHFAPESKYLFFPLSKNFETDTDKDFEDILGRLCVNLPPTIFCSVGQKTNIISQEL